MCPSTCREQAEEREPNAPRRVEPAYTDATFAIAGVFVWHEPTVVEGS